jgi:predicted hydrocarbon binding protein/KaiC/GvpD/RAD55 family RecA-like ATPase
LVTLDQIQEVPSKNLILLVGPPGSGKSAFCEQAVLQSLSINKPIIFVTTECDPSETKKELRERGLGETEPGLLSFIDAYNETVGLSVSDRPDTVYADSYDLSSIDIAISKLQDRVGKDGVLLVFDSLTSPYLYSGSEILRFMKQTLSRFAAKGNAVIACIDEGCGKQEDLVAMMSQAHGIIKFEMEEDQRTLNVIKHPKMGAAKIPFSGKGDATPIPYEPKPDILIKYAKADRYVLRSLSGKLTARKKMGDWVNILWYQLIFWGGLQWDPMRFPSLMYNIAKERNVRFAKYFKYGVPWYWRLFIPLLFRFLIPNKWSVKGFKRLWRFFESSSVREGHAAIEYLNEISRDDEHHFRKTESAGVWGFPNVGAAICFHETAEFAGLFGAFDRQGWDWDGVEYMCIGRGDPYCQLKISPEKSPEFQEFLRGFDSSILEKINEHIMGRILSLVLHGETFPSRPTLGDGLHLHEIQGDTSRQAVFSERFQTVLRMAGANSGRKIATLLLDNGVKEADTTKRLIDLFQLTKAGELSVGETVRIEENCESFGLNVGQSLCFFTTGFLNGFFSVTKNQHLKETKCVAAGDPYCEWEFR